LPKILKEHDETVTLRIPRPLKDWLQREADEEDLSLSGEIRSCLELVREVTEGERTGKTR
jgi:hypothetical protein